MYTCIRMCLYSFVYVCAKTLQLCPTLCNPMGCNQSDSSVHGILQARIMERVAVPLLHGIFRTQGSNLHLMSPALPGGFFTLAPPGKPRLYIHVYKYVYVRNLNLVPDPQSARSVAVRGSSDSSRYWELEHPCGLWFWEHGVWNAEIPEPDNSVLCSC